MGCVQSLAEMQHSLSSSSFTAPHLPTCGTMTRVRRTKSSREKGRGVEQRDALMPLLYALSQHQGLLAVQSQLRSSERLFAFLDDIYVVSGPERTCEVYNILQKQLWDYSRIQINTGKTQIWNRAGVVPRGHDDLLRLAQLDDPEAQIWFGDWSAPPQERGIRVLGTPLGLTPSFGHIFKASWTPTGFS